MTSDFYQNYDFNYAGPSTADGSGGSGSVDLTGTNPPAIFLPQTSDLNLEPTMYDPGSTLIPPTTGGAASNSKVQSSAPGSGILGWLGLANSIANTTTNAARTGGTTRPGVLQKPASMSSFGTMTAGTLLVVVAVFIGTVFLLRK